MCWKFEKGFGREKSCKMYKTYNMGNGDSKRMTKPAKSTAELTTNGSHKDF